MGEQGGDGRERRRFTRVALDAQVQVRVPSTDVLFESRVRDLSENGVYIITSQTRPIGTELDLVIDVANGSGVVEAKGLIVHEVTPDEATDRRPVGMGIMFIEVLSSIDDLRNLIASGEVVP